MEGRTAAWKYELVLGELLNRALGDEESVSMDASLTEITFDPRGGHSDYYTLQPDVQNIADIATGKRPGP